VRNDNEVLAMPPAKLIEKLSESQVEEPVTLLKVAYKLGAYYMYHERSLSDEDFSDSSKMIWFAIKNMNASTLFEK
jgi:hypothetical protein